MTENKTDYKETLNLPDTAFAMRANLPQKEPERLAKWQAWDLYQQIRQDRQGKKQFILHMGPPYANGDIHIGHALTTILKDIVVKSKTLSGYDAPLVPGWDCHGLPIELNVEKKIGLPNVAVTPEVFRAHCREYAQSQIDLQKASFIRLGILADWENPYKTMDFSYQADIMRVLGKILAREGLHQGARPVHWCISCGSSLAEAEVEYQNKTSPALDVCFPVVDPALFLKAIGVTDPALGRRKIAFVIWTTTPWTLPANEAVALHPQLDYVLVQADFGVAEVICIQQDLMQSCLARYGITDYQVLAIFSGERCEKLLVQHPFYDRCVPIVLGEHVTVDSGTGAVHTAPAHGIEDYQVGLQYQLPVVSLVSNRGKFLPETALVGGLSVLKDQEKIIEILKEKGTLLHATTLSHSYPHCWRHKTPLIFRATPQWFIGMEKGALREKALAEIEKVEWVPTWGRARMRSLVEQRPDWCISRQRTWGVPLPLLLHKDTHALHPDSVAIVAHIADLVQSQGIEAWYTLDLQALPFDNLSDYEKSSDILDVWFDSGSSHFAVLTARPDLRAPADLYLEGADQHRGWFQTSLLTSTAMQDTAPYRAVLTHGFTVDAHGKKMSKSLGNVIAPEQILKTLGADVLRLWVSSTDYKNEVHVSQEILTRMSDAYRRIRNTARFLLANLKGFDPEKNKVDPDKLLPLDAWIIDTVARIQTDIITHYDTYQFHFIYQKIHNLCVDELGSFYLDVIKDRQYTTQKDSLARRSAQTALYYILHALTRWLAPILSFTAEEIWEQLPGATGHSVFLSEWCTDLPRLAPGAQMDDAFWREILQVRTIVNKALEGERTNGKIGSALQAEVCLYAQGDLYQRLAQLGAELRFVLITSAATLVKVEQGQASWLPTERPDLWLSVAASPHEKCARCWHHLADVNTQPEYPQLCDRCVVNVAGKGEQREYA